MAPTPPPFTRARSVSSRIRFFSSALKMRRCGLAATSESGELATKGTAILASLTMFLLAALLCNYGRGKCLIDIGTEGNGDFGPVQQLRGRFKKWLPDNSIQGFLSK